MDEEKLVSEIVNKVKELNQLSSMAAKHSISVDIEKIEVTNPLGSCQMYEYNLTLNKKLNNKSLNER